MYGKIQYCQKVHFLKKCFTILGQEYRGRKKNVNSTLLALAITGYEQIYDGEINQADLKTEIKHKFFYILTKG